MLLLGSFIPRDDAAWPKYVFNIYATSVSSAIIFLFPSIKLILFLGMPLPVKIRFYCTPEPLRISNIVIIVFHFFLYNLLQYFFCFLKISLSVNDLDLRYLFSSLDRVIKAFLKCLVICGASLALIHFFFIGA